MCTLAMYFQNNYTQLWKTMFKDKLWPNDISMLYIAMISALYSKVGMLVAKLRKSLCFKLER